MVMQTVIIAQGICQELEEKGGERREYTKVQQCGMRKYEALRVVFPLSCNHEDQVTHLQELRTYVFPDCFYLN